MKQQCYLANVWLTWLGLPIIAIAMGVAVKWWAGLFVLVAGIFAQWMYIKVFPSMSRLLGYGSVKDEAASSKPHAPSVPKVTLYTANVCPFCPIVRQRLAELQREMKFALEEVDITFKPELIKAKGFRSVPVVEADGRYWIGNATTAQLVSFFAGSN